MAHIGQALAATLGVAAAVTGWAADRIVRLPTAAAPADAEAAVLSLTNHPTAATIGGFAKVVAAVGLVVAVGAFCYRARSRPLSSRRRWAPPTALACLSAWAATEVVAAAVRGALARLAARSVDTAAVRFGLDFADYLTALGLVLLAAGAIHLAVTAGWWAGDLPRDEVGAARAVQSLAVVVALAAGIVAVLAAPRMPEPGRSSDGNVFEPGSTVHGGVTVAWVVLLVVLAIDGWWRQRAAEA